MLLFNALFMPHLMYGIEIWGSTTAHLLNPLVKLQKKAIRFVGNKKHNAHTSDLFNKHNVLQLSQLYTLQINKLMFKAFHGILPPNLQTLYKPNQTTRTTRQTNLNLTVLRKKTKLYNNKPSVCGPYFWNNVNNNTRMTKTIKAFNSRLKKTLLTQQ